MLSSIPYKFENLNYSADALRVYVNYHAQQDPQVVFDVLSRLSSEGF